MVNFKKFAATKAIAVGAAIAIAIAIILLNVTAASAQGIPSPHGISGFVYDLDGITQAPVGTDFSINNTANSQFVQGKTGKPGNPGKYVASINGNDGNTIIFKTWNIEHSSSKNFTLAGVMRNVNILLNLTLSRYPPIITSTPITTATEDFLYTYDVEAFDYNTEDVLTYYLAVAPSGMAISPATGLITWAPSNSQVGSNAVAVNVSDGNFTVSQPFTVEVENTNDAPLITSVPTAFAREDNIYTYNVIATDDDKDMLAYLLTKAPAGMGINVSTGAISWLPVQSNVGLHNVTITVTDGKGGWATQSFLLEIESLNDAPVIISAAVTEATQDSPYYYDVQATDEDGDELNYWLVHKPSGKPSGMTANGTTGAIKWKPDSSQVGLNNVTVRVTDGLLFSDQSFTVNVANVNDLPIITSVPVTAAVQDLLYAYHIEATDPDNDLVTYSLVAAPANMTINFTTGLTRWMPTNWQTGPNNVTIGASDGNGTTTQSFTIVVENVNDAPVIISKPVLAAIEDSKYEYQANATDPDGDRLTYSLKEAPSGMLVDATSGLIVWLPQNEHVGNNTVVVEVSDTNLTTTQAFMILVAKSKKEKKGPHAGGGGAGLGIISEAVREAAREAARITRVSQAHGQMKGEPKAVFIENEKVPISELRIKFKSPVPEAGVDVVVLSEKPADVKSIQKRVYGYVQIQKINFESDDVEEAAISFRVEKLWLSKNKVEAGNVALNRYSASQWEELPTSLVGEDGGFAYYEAKAPGFSVFAIAVKSEVSIDEINNRVNTFYYSSTLPSSYTISGIVLLPDKKAQVPHGTVFLIENLNNNDTVSGVTGIGPASGMLFAVISGNKGDRLRMRIGNFAEMNFTLEGDLENAVFVADFGKGKLSILKTKAKIDGITGLTIAERLGLGQNQPQSLALLSLAAVAAVIAFAAIKLLRRRKKNPKRKKPNPRIKKRKKEGKKYELL